MTAGQARPQRGHRWFAACWQWMVDHEPRNVKKLREELVTPASGRVLEVGCGNGGNFPFYTASASVVAIDPDPYMLERARHRLASLDRPVEIRQAAAEELPFEDASFDTVVCTAVLCTVRDPARSLAEMRRVLVPGGRYIFFEHVRDNNRVGALWQNLMSPIWRWLGAGCRPNQDTQRFIEAAGFRIQELEHLNPSPPGDPTRPCIKGVALRD